MYWCMFEQSGTFKNEFKKLGFDAVDVDINDEFNEVDYKVDLFHEIDEAFENRPSIFDLVCANDMILAFFPCVRFEVQFNMKLRGESYEMAKWSDEKKLLSSMRYHDELHRFYMVICKLCLVCIRLNIPLMIENPYQTQHYLTRYFPLKPSVIDMNRLDWGDYFEKPTQYWFVNCSPKNNFVFESTRTKKPKKIDNVRGIDRSLICPEYANRFIREFLI